mgnify:CR=1 FL=1
MNRNKPHNYMNPIFSNYVWFPIVILFIAKTMYVCEHVYLLALIYHQLDWMLEKYDETSQLGKNGEHFSKCLNQVESWQGLFVASKRYKETNWCNHRWWQYIVFGCKTLGIHKPLWHKFQLLLDNILMPLNHWIKNMT